MTVERVSIAPGTTARSGEARAQGGLVVVTVRLSPMRV